jgi:hypothetical protein
MISRGFNIFINPKVLILRRLKKISNAEHMTQVVEHLPSKHKALSSNSILPKQKERSLSDSK